MGKPEIMTLMRYLPYGIIVAAVVAVFVLLDERAQLAASVRAYRSEISVLSDELTAAQERIDAQAVAEMERAEAARDLQLSEDLSALDGLEDGTVAPVLGAAIEALR